MRLAILITNTDFSAFARARPDDGAKFATLIHEARPDWTCVPYWCCKGAFPDEPVAYDGLIITGSPASVTEDAPWMLRLQDVIRDALARRQKIFAACFGHQLVARALGGAIIRNPQGWAHGLLQVSPVTPVPWIGADPMRLYGSHIEQVAKVPHGLEVIYEGPGLPVAGMAQGNHLFTLQHHPEMTHGFITDLVEQYVNEVGPEVTARARHSLSQQADRARVAGEIARFFKEGR